MKIKLEKVIHSLGSEKDVQKFLKDLLSPKEYESLRERWKVVQLLEKKMPYREISEKLGVSTATVTRVARCLSNPDSGYKMALEVLKVQKIK